LNCLISPRSDRTPWQPLDAKYTEVNNYAQATTGPYSPKTPRLKLSLSPDAHTKLSNGVTLRLGVAYTHTSEIYNDVQDTWQLRRPKGDLLNASCAIISPNGKATFTVGRANLTNRRFITTGQVNDAAGAVYGTYNAPREWYATVGVKY
jgi:hypothetical protein